ncbi:hypothetical protein HgNV_082 [Homarus gammarus nudivirus]|uniref:Uncharacterized protein n=1 Tax=Homarus gammarus nudivirus TaxID=2509616 RepID=A0A411HBC5_9VIRU|nr:hypothetical protein KM727_gp82 [Homarus gammarus nudivirus]QBB28687.1 hypothetical protein HgNV_082 [Homarus gammarus nudivirus]
MSLVEHSNGKEAMDNFHTHVPSKLIQYIQNTTKTSKVVHLYYGSKMMSKYSWTVIPYEISPYDKLIDNMQYLTTFRFLGGVRFVLYNGTNRYLNFDHLGIPVFNVYRLGV